MTSVFGRCLEGGWGLSLILSSGIERAALLGDCSVAVCIWKVG